MQRRPVGRGTRSQSGAGGSQGGCCGCCEVGTAIHRERASVLTLVGGRGQGGRRLGAGHVPEPVDQRVKRVQQLPDGHGDGRARLGGGLLAQHRDHPLVQTTDLVRDTGVELEHLGQHALVALVQVGSVGTVHVALGGSQQELQVANGRLLGYGLAGRDQGGDVALGLGRQGRNGLDVYLRTNLRTTSILKSTHTTPGTRFRGGWR